MAESKVNPYPSTNAAYNNTAYNNTAYNNTAYNNAAYPSGPSAPMDGGAPPAYDAGNAAPAPVLAPAPVPVVQTQTVTMGVPMVNTQIYRQAVPMPQTYILHNILILLFCCLLFGIIGIVKGSQVDSLYIRGNYAAAEQASLSARKWYIWGLAFGCVLYVTFFVLFMCLLLFI